MKTIIRMTIAGLFTLMITAGNVFGQGNTNPRTFKHFRNTRVIYSVQQKEMLKQRADLNLNFMKAFRSSISQKQKDILGDPRLIRSEREKEFRASLTDNQVSLIKNHRADIQKMRQEFRATLSPEQKAELKKNGINRRMGPGAGFMNCLAS